MHPYAAKNGSFPGGMGNPHDKAEFILAQQTLPSALSENPVRFLW